MIKDPSYLARHDMRRTPTGIVQRPGPRNSLGRIKFDFDSAFGVYLHDTTAPTLFDRQARTLSDGCARLEEAQALAGALLEGQVWSTKDVEAAREAEATRRVALRAPVPLFCGLSNHYRRTRRLGYLPPRSITDGTMRCLQLSRKASAPLRNPRLKANARSPQRVEPAEERWS